MTLAYSVNIAQRDNTAGIVRDMLTAFRGPAAFHIRDGEFSFHALAEDEFDAASEAVADCRFVYVLESHSGLSGPICAFVANESLRTAVLHHLIDGRPEAGASKLPRRTTETVGVHIRDMFQTFDWLDVVNVPARIDSLDGVLGLSVSVFHTAMCRVRLRPGS